MCNLEHNTFLREKEQLSLEEEVETRITASVYFRMERAIEQVKMYYILQGVTPYLYMLRWR